jgi:DNA replication protein DnaC
MDSLKKVAQQISARAFAKRLTNNVADVCTTCNGTEVEIVAGRGARPCTTCRPELNRIMSLRERKPRRYQAVTLETLEPRLDLHAEQANAIAWMRKHPFMNYYLCGEADTGKTHLMWALYDHALISGRTVVICSLFELVEAAKTMFRNTETRPPRLISEMEVLNRPNAAEYPCSIFIDDVDKARPTEYVAELFFNYVDRIYRNKHQLVVTSQLDPEKSVNGRASLIDHFENADPRYAMGIVRRMVNDETAAFRFF